MFEIVQTNEKKVDLNVHLKKVKPKNLSCENLFRRASIEQFENPIYAGFDIQDEQKQRQNLGPWTESQTNIIPKTMLISNKPKMERVQDFVASQKLENVSVRKHKSSRSQLPEIKGKIREGLRQMKVKSVQLRQKKQQIQSVQQNKSKNNKKFLNNLIRNQSFKRRPLQKLQRKSIFSKMVVYNYCTNADHCLLDYASNRKEELINDIDLQKIAKGRLSKLKTYYNSKPIPIDNFVQ